MDGTQPTIYPPFQVDPLDPYTTESQGEVTQLEWDVGPIKSSEGYVGSNKHFGVRCNVIKIKNSDAVADNKPSEEQRQLREFTAENEKRFSQHELQKPGDDTYQDWMQKIGPYLADWALGLPRNGAFLCFPPAFFLLPASLYLTDNMTCVSREPPLEAHEIPGQLHALGPQVRHRDRPRQPTHRHLSIRRAAPRSPHLAHPIELHGLPIPDGIRSPRHMAHEGSYGQMRLQVLSARPAPE